MAITVLAALDEAYEPLRRPFGTRTVYQQAGRGRFHWQLQHYFDWTV